MIVFLKGHKLLERQKNGPTIKVEIYLDLKAERC